VRQPPGDDEECFTAAYWRSGLIGPGKFVTNIYQLSEHIEINIVRQPPGDDEECFTAAYWRSGLIGPDKFITNIYQLSEHIEINIAHLSI